ncbi:MAG: sel1 repeat family protein [Alphaproteobacteria bacterium]|jgi:uncharacterized protein|nr:sel1 repeat family protein [Alphaproteobacteria bacterium]MBT4017769.1 sel1 repeat family protein [Alphaproteobacteria bacterium]MBT4964734.1 sel1 repeat family protein [Alphaproteobacteria bacterium]MBT5160144.1 sel1 repeat family protein [Alphaproteobacteria bacterium]
MRNMFILVFWIVLALPVSAHADFSAGLRAYRDGAYASAFQSWKVLAEKGDAKAQNNLGILYRKGLGVEKNAAEAFKWYKRAANQNFAKAQFNLGLMYKQGNGIKQDLKKALKWYRKSAINGYPRAQYALALRYENGRGVKRHRVNALKWLNLALNKASGKFRVSVAAAHRRVSERLTDAEVEEARHLAEDIKQEG